MKNLYQVFIYTLLFNVCGAFAQKVDTAQLHQNQINEALVLKDQQQQQIDSLVKVQLQQELANAQGDLKKENELRNRLQKIETDDSLRQIRQLQKIAVLKKTAKGQPVTLTEDTLFYIYTKIGSFSAKDRAISFSDKLEKLYEDPFYTPDSLRVVANEENYDMVYGKQDILFSVTPLDAIWHNKKPVALANGYLALVKKEIQRERDAHSLLNWVKRIALVLLIIAFLWLIIWAVNKLFVRLAKYIGLHINNWLGKINLEKLRFLSASKLEYAALKLLLVIKIIVIAVIIYLSLPLLFSVFPETEAWTGTLLGWVLNPLRSVLVNIVHYLPNLFTVLVIYFIFRYTVKFIRYIFDEIRLGSIQINGFHKEWARPTFNIIRFLAYAFMLIVIFPYLPGHDSPAFQGVSVFLGILFSFGSTSAITNIIAGLVITYMRPFKIGDRVKIGDVTGDIIEKTMLVTRIRTIKNEDITVPNSTILNNSTVNYSNQTVGQAAGLIINLTVSIGYDVPWKTVYQLLIDAAQKTSFVELTPKPFVLQTSLDDFYVSYQINAYTKQASKQAVIYSNLMENIQDAFAAAEIEIMSPHYRAVRDGNDPALPGA